ncbi:hypothetical protein FI667_g7968, partial [Globisporangium splendens]
MVGDDAISPVSPDGSATPLEHALLRFTAVGCDELRDELLSSDARAVTHPQSALESLQELTQLVLTTDATAFFAQHKAVVAVVKELCRILTAYTASVTADQPEDVAIFLRLDGYLVPMVGFLGAFTDREQLEKQEPSEAQRHDEVYEPKELLRHIPAADAMRSFTEADRILTACEAITATKSRSELFARYIEQLVALSSQGTSKEAWVDQHSIPKHVLLWITVQVPFPHLGGDVLGRLLALVFPLIDDLHDATQLVGARMLHHVVHNVTSTELRWYSDVLLEVLRVAIASRKQETIDVLLECLSTTLDKLSPPSEFAHYDKFFPRLLNDTSLCSDVTIRIVFLRRLRPMIMRMGAPNSIHLIRYLQPLLKVIIATFESINVPLLLETLETLRVTILCAWPRIPSHSEEIFVGVMRAVAFCEVFDSASADQTPDPDEKASILERCEDILGLLHDLDSPGRDEATAAVDSDSGNASQSQASVLKMLQDVGSGCAPLPSSTQRHAKRVRSDAAARRERNKRTEFSVGKTTLNTFCTEEAKAFPWTTVLKKVNKTIAEAYILANIHIARVCEEGFPIPTLDHPFFYGCLSAVSVAERSKSAATKNEQFMQSVMKYKSWIPPDYKPPNSSHLSSGWHQQASQQMATTATNAISLNFLRRFKRYLQQRYELESKHAYLVMQDILAKENSEIECEPHLFIPLLYEILAHFESRHPVAEYTKEAKQLHLFS